MTVQELSEGVKALMTAYEQANKCVLADLWVNTEIQRYLDGQRMITRRSITLKIDEQ
jgi:hypothetical protein